MNSKFALASLLVLGLSACGSDDNPPAPPEPPIEQPQNEAWNYIETPYTENFNTKTVTGKIEVRLGEGDIAMSKWFRTAFVLAKQGDMSYDFNGDGWINRWDFSASGARVNDTSKQLDILGSHMDEVLKTNPDGLGAGTARPDIFVEGHYTVFDLLRYLVATRSDLRFDNVITPEESEYNTHEFTLSWDKNADGDFTNDGVHSNSDLWHFALQVANGDNKDTSSSSQMYFRMDEYRLKRGDKIRFLPTSEALKGRRTLVWKHEVEKKAQNDGKVIADVLMYLRTPNLADAVPVAQQMEVRAFNLRSDIFQPGVITGMDYFLTAAADYGIDLGFSFWPTLSTNVPFDGFVLSKGPQGQGKGFKNWFGRLLQNPAAVLADMGGNCMHMNDQGGPSQAIGGTGMWTLGQEECDRWFISGNGGYNVNIDQYTLVHNYGIDQMIMGQDHIIGPDLEASEQINVFVDDKKLLRGDGFGLFDASSCKNSDCDTAIVRKLIPATEESPVGNAPILQETHFGWKIADCTQCHNDQKDPNGHGGASWPVNAADGFDVQQPHYCATCHGNNGATPRHAQETRCSFCHNAFNEPDQDYAPIMPNHGEASALFQSSLSDIQYIVTALPSPSVNLYFSTIQIASMTWC